MTSPAPSHATAALVLADGRIFWGQGIGAIGTVGGEVCFNTSMSGYQEILTDPSYAGQIITFTFPHIGNVGTNALDDEATLPYAKGLILRTDITSPSNYRSQEHFNTWLCAKRLTGICGIDTRALTAHLRNSGSQNGVIRFSNAPEIPDTAELHRMISALPNMVGLDIAKTVSTKTAYTWDQTTWKNHSNTYGHRMQAEAHVVVIDYGVKHNILRCLAQHGLKLTVVPCDMSAEDILALQPDGIFLSNGPGDPAATGIYAVPILQKLMTAHIPIFGICLGHQLLALAAGGKTGKLPFGHRGANHPVKDLQTGKIEITSQNHGFHVIPDSLPSFVEATHISLFDGTNEGLQYKDRPIFSVQYHPEASPGPHDSHPLFLKFAQNIFNQKSTRKTA